MAWRKLGLLYEPRTVHPQLRSHAANPVPLHLGGDRYRILFNGRDERNRSAVGWVDIDLASRSVIAECSVPLVGPGPVGSFYADGISLGNVYSIGTDRYLPFMGWQSPPGQHWWGELGRFRLEAGGHSLLDPPGIWFGRNEVEGVSVSYPWVMALPTGGYRMWYGTTLSWDAGNGEMLHVLRSADSADGHRWVTDNRSPIPYAIGQAQAFSRPTVAQLPDGTWRMWFSVRSGQGESYRIGAAASRDLLRWDRVDEGLGVSDTGWDSEMVEYPCAFEHGGRLLLLYNGNGYGRTGFGLAEWT